MNQELLNRLDALSAKIGVTVQYLWGTLLRQAHIEGYIQLAWGIGEMIAICVLVRIGWKHIKTWDDWMPAYLMAGFVVLILFVFCCINLANFPTPLLNPDYWALSQILGALR